MHDCHTIPLCTVTQLTPDTHREGADPMPHPHPAIVRDGLYKNQASPAFSTFGQPHEMLGTDEGGLGFFQLHWLNGIVDTTGVKHFANGMVRDSVLSPVRVCRLSQGTFSRSRLHVI